MPLGQVLVLALGPFVSADYSRWPIFFGGPLLLSTSKLQAPHPHGQTDTRTDGQLKASGLSLLANQFV